MSLSVEVAELFSGFVSSSSSRLFGNPLNCVDVCGHSLSLTCPLSADGPGVLGDSIHGRFDLRSQSPLSAC